MTRRRKDDHQLPLLTDEQLTELEKIRWNEYKPALVLEASAKLGSDLAHLAEDVAQEAIYRAVASWGGYKPRGYLKAWLKKIARGVAVDMYRKHTTRDPRTGARVARAVALELEELADPYNPERMMDGVLLRDRVLTLPERPRTILLLYVLGGYSFGDIAASLHISRQAVHQHYRSIVRTLYAFMLEVNLPGVDKRPAKTIKGMKGAR